MRCPVPMPKLDLDVSSRVGCPVTCSIAAGSSAPIVRAAASAATDLSDLVALIRDSLQQQPRPDIAAASVQAPPVKEAGPSEKPQPTSQASELPKATSRAPELPEATSQAPELPQPPSVPQVPQASGNAATEAAQPAPSNDVPAEAASVQAQAPSLTVEPMPNDVPPSGDCQADAGSPWLRRGLQESPPNSLHSWSPSMIVCRNIHWSDPSSCRRRVASG